MLEVVPVADALECSSDSNRTSTLLPTVYRWLKSSDRGVGLGKFAGAGVAVARPRCGAWPHLRAAPFVACDTSIGCASRVEC